MTGLPPNLLALTVLAWGNSIGDFMANTSIAKKGFAEMALTGCFAAPLFNNVLGLGLSTFKTNVVAQVDIITSSQDAGATIPTIMILGNFVTMSITLFWTICSGFKITKT